MLDLTIIGLSLAANGLVWYLIGRCNLKRGEAKTFGPPGSNFEKVRVSGVRALEVGRKRRGWGMAGVIVGAVVLLAGLIFGGLNLSLFGSSPDGDKKRQELISSAPPPPLTITDQFPVPLVE